jgi:hypothetical protein
MTSRLRQRDVPITAHFSRHFLPIHVFLLRIVCIFKMLVFGVLCNVMKRRLVLNRLVEERQSHASGSGDHSYRPPDTNDPTLAQSKNMNLDCVSTHWG